MSVHNLVDLKNSINVKSRFVWPHLIVGHLKIGLFDDTFMIHRDGDVTPCKAKDIVNLVNELVSA